MVSATPEASAWLDQPLTSLPGIGPARAEQLARGFGVRSVGELLRCAPRRYEEPAQRCRLAELVDGERVRVEVTARGASLWRRGRRSTLRVRVEDDSAQATALYFNQPYLKDAFPEGRIMVLEGRVSLKQGATLLSPRIVREEDQAGGKLSPVYPETEGVPSGLLPKAVAAAMQWEGAIDDPLPAELLALAKVPPLAEALRQLHAPGDLESAQQARRRLAWGEVLARELSRRRKSTTEPVPPRARDNHIWERILSRIPFELTSDQHGVLEELRSDLSSGRPMARLLHGEVGSGKTAVAFALALAVAADGGQAALLAPTEILARQHLQTFRQWLKGSQLKVVGLLGDDSAALRRETLESLRHKTAQIAVGTHALYGSAVHFSDLALVILDEQHRFGVRQKGALLAKGKAPHVLTMTATPIPRTLAWAQYGALDPCILRARPSGAGDVRTHATPMVNWPKLARKLRPFLEKDGRLFLVAPRIDGPGGLKAHAKELLNGPWKGIPYVMAHGRMDGCEVEESVAAFRRGEARVLLGTTVVEVGLDVPGVPAMVILEAHRLGLASLHQLRGRLARGVGSPSADCWLLGDESSMPRLKRLEACRDGFAVAELDLQERGPGAMRGTRQHGRSDFRVFDPFRDADLVDCLRQPAAGRFLDSHLEGPAD